VRQFPRGKPAVTLEAAGAILASDRLDLHSAKERQSFAAGLNGHAETVAQELLVVAQLLDDLDQDELAAGPSQYDSTANGLIWHRPIQGGSVPVPLTNFAATIVADVVEDDGAEIRRQLEIEARLNGRTFRFTIPAERFGGMVWATEHLGASAIVYPGISLRDHARVAIQLLSGDIPERRVYTHLGWRQLGDEWVYLHGSGAIGPDGPVTGIEVHLPEQLSR
jgi:hypothetical protein